MNGFACLVVCASALGATSGGLLATLEFHERVFQSPGGETRLERWNAAADQTPMVVRARHYVSGMALAPGIAMIFQVTQQQWMLRLNDQLISLKTLQQVKGDAPLPVADAPNRDQFTFAHGGHQWQLMILGRKEPKPVPGIATEQEHTLDLLLWRDPIH